MLFGLAGLDVLVSFGSVQTPQFTLVTDALEMGTWDVLDSFIAAVLSQYVMFSESGCFLLVTSKIEQNLVSKYIRDRPICFFQGRYRLLVVKEADNQYLEPIFICSKRENNGVNILRVLSVYHRNRQLLLTYWASQ